MMQGDLNKAQGHPHSPTHTHNHTCMHTLSNILSHIIYAGEKYIKHLHYKTVQGPQCSKIPLPSDKNVEKNVWVVISLCLMYAKLSPPLPSTKYLFSLTKNIPTV